MKMSSRVAQRIADRITDGLLVSGRGRAANAKAGGDDFTDFVRTLTRDLSRFQREIFSTVDRVCKRFGVETPSAIRGIIVEDLGELVAYVQAAAARGSYRSIAGLATNPVAPIRYLADDPEELLEEIDAATTYLERRRGELVKLSGGIALSSRTFKRLLHVTAGGRDEASRELARHIKGISEEVAAAFSATHEALDRVERALSSLERIR